MNKLSLVATKATNSEKLKQGLLSFDSGIKNVIGMLNTTKTIRLRFINTTTADQTILIAPQLLLGNAIAALDLTTLGLPLNAFPFFNPAYVPSGAAAGEQLTCSCLNDNQTLPTISGALNSSPIQITAISMKSFNTDGTPENTNYGNSLSRYRLSPWDTTRRVAQLNFEAFQNSRDTATEILKIDLVKNNFEGLVSQEDVLTLKINAGTRMDITFNVGGRVSIPEYFQRQISGGIEIVKDVFSGESALSDNCGC